MSKPLDIDGGNNPTIGKRVLFFIRRDATFVKGWPAKILDNYGSTMRAPNDPSFPPVNSFCEVGPLGQVIYLVKVETADGDHVLQAYADSGRSPGSFDEYKDGDLRI